MSFSNQPVSNVRWIHVDELEPNLYNPNTVHSPEFRLLKESILSDGWLFPVTVLDKSIHIEGLTNNPSLDRFTVIDGFHRRKLTKVDPEIYALTDGHVPCLVLNPVNPMATTVRLNRAKGTHGVLPMAEIVKAEIEKGTAMQVIMKDYGMEEEEVIRLANRVGIPKSKVISNTGFSKAWVPE